MADQSEITLGVGVAPTVVEHEGGRRKGRGKSRDPSRAREDLGDLEKRLAKVELHLVDGEERFEEVDTRLVELDERMEELRRDMQGALNAAIDKLASEGESLRLSQMGEIAALRDENRSLKEQLELAMGKLKEVEQQVSLVAMAVARGGVATTSGASLVIPSRVEVPKPSLTAFNHPISFSYGMPNLLASSTVRKLWDAPVSNNARSFCPPTSIWTKGRPFSTFAVPFSWTFMALNCKDPKECKRGHTPKLQKGHPPREKVDCARDNAVARSPKEESSPRQEGPRRHRSRKSRRKCKAEGRAGALSHRDEGGTAGAQREKARSNTAVHAGRHGRRSKRRGRRAD
ncbi:hypothetical protein P3X46_003570 [Hevea brasiliensis]|uniref:C3H1-type domain-containing protein n=1 Tax=Hevea brasiliensis TaxID=3981 RepID=A0ABQ9N9Y1_HEVBR|nr:hypothetical protein P3X46_003570 [Hevea brasiliensis]